VWLVDGSIVLQALLMDSYFHGVVEMKDSLAMEIAQVAMSQERLNSLIR